MATYALRGEVARSAVRYGPQVDEFEAAGIAWLPSTRVAPRRVAASPVHFECQVLHTLHIPGRIPEAEATIVVGQAVGIHIRDDVVTEDGRIDVLQIKPLARLGYLDFTTVDRYLRGRGRARGPAPQQGGPPRGRAPGRRRRKGVRMHAFPRPDQTHLSVERTTVAGACPACGREDLRRYPVLSDGGWFLVVKCQACLHSVSRGPWTAWARRPPRRRPVRSGLMIGVDVGGTFTDVVAIEDGTIEVAKVPTDPTRAASAGARGRAPARRRGAPCSTTPAPRASTR